MYWWIACIIENQNFSIFVHRWQRSFGSVLEKSTEAYGQEQNGLMNISNSEEWGGRIGLAWLMLFTGFTAEPRRAQSKNAEELCPSQKLLTNAELIKEIAFRVINSFFWNFLAQTLIRLIIKISSAFTLRSPRLCGEPR